MDLYNEFATMMVNVELPPWFYAVKAIARLVPLVKAKLTPEQVAAGAEPDARPVAIGEVEARAIGRQLVQSAADPSASK